MIVRDLSNLPNDDFSVVRYDLEKLQSLAEVLNWAGSTSIGKFVPGIVSEVIGQDEYTHDVIIPFNHSFLVFDTT
ncbi:MAG: hypothetical protein R2681_18075 [Pyrinomonadaceae bacterium]